MASKYYAYQIGTFLEKEWLFCFEPTNSNDVQTSYCKRVLPNIIIPEKESLSDIEVAQILGNGGFRKFKEFLEGNDPHT